MLHKQMASFSLLFFSLLCTLIYADNTHNACASHQFVPRSLSTNLTYTNLLNFYERHHKKKNQRVIYATTFIYQKSKKSSDLGSALLLGSSNCINVTQESPGDVSSYWLGLGNIDPVNPFASTFCIKPERKTIGYYGYFFVDLSDWIRGLWMDTSIVIFNAEHILNCCEQGDSSTACSEITTVGKALNNPIYQFGKFNCSTCTIDKSRTGIDDAQLRLGYERNWCNDKIIGGAYAIGTIPSGDDGNAEYVFQASTGTGHGSLGIGIESEYLLCSRKTTNTALLFDANYRYAFKHKQRRTFDLCKNGPLSRFLLVAKQSDPTVALPGVNFLTQSVNVTPRSTAQIWLALHHNRRNYDLEFGYNFFWRQAEKLIFCGFCDDRAFGVYQLNCAGNGCTTASTATIAQGPNQIIADTEFVTITANDLNLASATGGEVLSNKLYIAAEIKGHTKNDLNWFIGVGGSHEFVTQTYRCTTLPMWAVFAKIGLIF